MAWFQAISDLLGVLVWPAVVAFFLWVFRDPIRVVIGGLRRARWRDFEMEFGRGVDQAEEKAQGSDLPVSPPAALPELEEPIRAPAHFAQLASWSPRAAVLAVWVEVEKALRVATGGAASHATAFRSPGALVRELERREVLDRDTAALIEDLGGLRNQAAHASEFSLTVDDATKYVALSLAVARRLRGE